jgi:hypothetical protein
VTARRKRDFANFRYTVGRSGSQSAAALGGPCVSDGRAYGKAGGAAGPLTEAEVKWLEGVTPRLIRRAAKYEAKVPSPPANHYGRSTTAIRLTATIAASPKIVPIRDSGHGFSSKGSLQQSSRSVSRSVIGCCLTRRA